MEDNKHSICKRLVEKKFGRGGSHSWIDQDFKILREEIQKEANTLISVNTLKRYFGKVNTSDQYDPQRETKNALAQYIGFKNWQTFLENEFPGARDESENSSRKKISPPTILSIPNRRKLLLRMALGLFGALVLIFFYRSAIQTSIPEWRFKILNPSDTVPYTMTMRFSIGGEEKDTFSLKGNFPEKKNLDRKDTMLTIFESFPTYSWIEFCYNGKTLSKIPFHALSHGWEVYYNHIPDKKLIQVPKQITKGKYGIGVPKDWFSKIILDSMEFDSEIRNFKNFALDGDNFTAEFSTFLPKSLNPCQSIIIRIYGSEKHLEYRLALPSCSQQNFINLSENFYDGRYSDLSKINHPGQKTTITRVQVVNKRFTLFIDGKSVFSQTYEKPVGSIKGIYLQVTRFGYLQSFRAWNARNELVENEVFVK